MPNTITFSYLTGEVQSEVLPCINRIPVCDPKGAVMPAARAPQEYSVLILGFPSFNMRSGDVLAISPEAVTYIDTMKKHYQESIICLIPGPRIM